MLFPDKGLEFCHFSGNETVDIFSYILTVIIHKRKACCKNILYIPFLIISYEASIPHLNEMSCMMS